MRLWRELQDLTLRCGVDSPAGGERLRSGHDRLFGQAFTASMILRLIIMNLQSNDFELFGLPPQFAVDKVALDERWKALQREAHPDRHATADAATQRRAMQWSVRINEAYQRLKDPIKRASYLCELNGESIGAENNTAMPAAFLMQQMQWREDLEDAESVADLERMADEVADVPRGHAGGLARHGR